MQYTLKIKISISMSDASDLLNLLIRNQTTPNHHRYQDGFLFMMYYGKRSILIPHVAVLSNTDNLDIIYMNLIKGDK